MSYEKYIEYLIPVIVAVIAGWVGYAFAYRNRKSETFYKSVYDSLSNICSPMYHQIRKIDKTVDSRKKEILLINLFETYSSQDSPLFKLANHFLLEWFYEMEDSFYIYLSNRTDDAWIEFWKKYHKFSIMIENEYFENNYVLYGDYKWFRSLVTKKFLFRFLSEIIAILIQTVKFLIAFVLLAIYFMFYGKIVGQSLIPENFNMPMIYVLAFLSILYGILMIIGSNYLTLTGMQKRNKFRKYIKENWTSIYKILEMYDRISTKNIEKKIIVPKRHFKID